MLRFSFARRTRGGVHRWLAVAAMGAACAGLAGSEPGAPPLETRVDARVELMSLVFRLAGHPEYNQARVPVYTADIDRHFGRFTNHAVVTMARQLRTAAGVSYDAVMAMAVHLEPRGEPRLRAPLDPWPEGLDRRWTGATAEKFVAALRDFRQETDFGRFMEEHRKFYLETEQSLRSLMEKQAHLEWFEQFFGERPRASFTLVPGLLNGGCCYGARFLHPTGKEELYSILGVWETGPDGLPRFTKEMLETVVHEFCHSYANPFGSRHAASLREPGQKLFGLVRDQMRGQAYGDAETMLREYMVRACVIRYVNRYEGAAAAAKAVKSEEGRGFQWMKGLVDLLGEYEASPAGGLDKFAPRIVTYFETAAAQASQRAKLENERRPRVVSMVPTNGAERVDPRLAAIEIVFDRPMQDKSWSLVGGGEHFPELVGQPAYDAGRTKWKVGIRLKPEWDYEFGVNSARFTAFRSAEGVSVTPIWVKFRTGRGN